MQKVNYNLTVAGWSVNSADDTRTELLSLESTTALNSPAAHCRLVVYAPPAPKAGLLEQAAGAAMDALGLGEEKPGSKAFSVDVRGQKIAYGDKLSLKLSAGDTSGSVTTAEVRSIGSSLGETAITARCGGHKLVTTRLNQVYQNQPAGQIVKDLASRSGVTPGDIEDGSTYPYLVVHESRNLWQHARVLAGRDSMDIYFDVDNKLTMKKFTKTTADHTFWFGIDVLDLELSNTESASEHIFVYGESASSNTGTDTWHWLAKDLKPFQGEAGEGDKTLYLSDGAVRTKDASGTAAKSKFGAIQDNAVFGRIRLMGNPKLQLGGAFEIKGCQKPELNGVFKITSVRHIYNKREGYVTMVAFSGKGGAEAAGDLLWALGGALAGAAGL